MAEERLGASFSIDVTALKAGLQQANRLIRESESEFKAAAAGMDDWTKSEEGLKAKLKSLNEIADLQRKKVEALEKQYSDAGYAADDMSEAAVKLRTDINNQKAALSKTESETKKYQGALDDLTASASGAGESVDDLGEAAKDSKEGFTVAKGAIANLVSSGIEKLTSSAVEAVSSLMALSDETLEYRENMNKLNTAFESAGKSTETAKAAYQGFYEVLGEEDRSVEAVAHLAKFVETEEDMAKWTDICAGAWATFGESLPIEGVTEAANETAKSGKLTGTLTDALVWAGVAEEDFQASLDKCNTEQERGQLITDTLNDLYKDAADLYKKNNKQVIEARKQTAKLTDAQADLGEAIEPINTGLDRMKTQLLQGLTPALKDKAIPQFKAFLNELEEDQTVEKFSEAVGNLANKALTGLSSAVKDTVTVIDFLSDHIDGITTVVAAATAGFIAFKASLAIGTAITTLSAATTGATTAFGALNAVLVANPIGAVATAVGLLVAGLVVLSATNDETTETTETLTAAQRELIDTSAEAAEAYRETKAAADELVTQQQSSVDYAQNTLIPELMKLVDANGEVQDSDRARAEFIVGQLNDALGTEYKSVNDIVSKNGELKQSVYDVIEAKRAQIGLEAYEESYKTAIMNVVDAEKARSTAAQDLVGAQDDLKAAEEKYQAAVTESDRLMGIGTDSAISRAAIIRSKADEEYQAVKNSYDGKAQKYKEAEENVQGYYYTIDAYERAATASVAGETSKVITELGKLQSGYTATASKHGETSDETIAQLKQQVIDTGVQHALLVEDYKTSAGSMTDEERRQAVERIEQAKQEALDAREQYNAVGQNMVGGMAKGVEDGTSVLEGAIRRAVQAALDAAEDEADINSPSKEFRKRVGLNLGLGTALGVGDSTKAVVKAVRNQVKTVEKAASDRAAELKNTVLSGTAGSGTASAAGGVTVIQNNTFAKSHSRYELYRMKQQTAAAVRLAAQGG